VSEAKGITPERLIFFSDAVVAIAITLLALDLYVPVAASNREFWHDVAAHDSEYLGFVISFAVIGAYWIRHHGMFGYVTRVSRALLRWNMLWLLTIVLTPFATRVLVADGAFAARFTVYATVQAAASVFFILAVWEMDRGRLVGEDLPAGRFAAAYLGAVGVAALFAVSIPLAYLVGRWAYLCWILIPVVTRAPRLIGRRGVHPG
jgi:uncharacterized membrane protein